MATYQGLVTAYRDSESKKRVVTDRIVLASPFDIATILALGGEDTSSKFDFVNTPGDSYEWLEDTYVSRSDSANDATNLTNDSTTTTIAVSTVNQFQVGNVIQIDSEYMHVTGINTSTGVLTVTRNFGGTQATHASTATIDIRYTAREDGDDSDDSAVSESTTGYNYTNIFHRDINISRSNQRLQRYGMQSAVDYYIDKKMDELMEELDRLPYHGQRVQGSASSPVRSAGGFDTFISTNTNALSSAALTKKNVDDMLEDCWDNGGVTDLILCDAWGQRKINSFYEGFVTTERSEQMGGIKISQLMNPITGAPVNIVVDRHCPTGTMYLLDTRHVGFVEFDPFFYEDLAKTGDAQNGEVVGEYSFVVQAEKRHGKISGYSISS